MARKVCMSLSYVYSSSHVWMWEPDQKEGWALKNWCFRTVVLEKPLDSPLDCKEIKSIAPKGNQPWILLERWMLKLKLQYFGHLMQRVDSLEETLMLGKMEVRRRRGRQRMRWSDTIDDSMVMSLSKLGDSEGQGSLACCSPWGRKIWSWFSNWVTTTSLTRYALKFVDIGGQAKDL